MTSTIPTTALLTGRAEPLAAVLLDMDGTLLDTEGLWWEAEVAVFARLGHRLDDSWRGVVVGGPMTRSAGYLIEATGAAIALEELSGLLNDAFEERIARDLPLMPGAARLLGELHSARVPTALVSASHRRIIDRALPALGAHHFAHTVAGDEVTRTKPHPEPYLHAARRLGVDPARCLVIEDTATGVASAEAAGCRVLAVPSVTPIPAATRRTVVSSLDSVDLGFLRGLCAG